MALKGEKYRQWRARMAERAQRIRDMVGKGISYPEIGKIYGISRQRARQIATGE